MACFGLLDFIPKSKEMEVLQFPHNNSMARVIKEGSFENC